MTNEDQHDPLDWVMQHCEPFVEADGFVSGRWIWPSGMVHTEAASVAMVRMHKGLHLEPTDLITAQLMCAVVDKLVELERRIGSLTHDLTYGPLKVRPGDGS